MTDPKPTAHWRIIMAAILNFFTAFFVLGSGVAFFTGDLTKEGFSLSGIPALVALLLIFGYFWAGNRYFGGTIWKRVLKIR